MTATIKTARIYLLAYKSSLTELKCVFNKSTQFLILHIIHNLLTHELGNKLHLIIYHIDSCLIHSITAGPLVSDHIILLFQILIQKPKLPTMSRSTRQLNNISTSQLVTDLTMLTTHDVHLFIMHYSSHLVSNLL